jgi:hypothetical protein
MMLCYPIASIADRLGALCEIDAVTEGISTGRAFGYRGLVENAEEKGHDVPIVA